MFVSVSVSVSGVKHSINRPASDKDEPNTNWLKTDLQEAQMMAHNNEILNILYNQCTSYEERHPYIRINKMLNIDNKIQQSTRREGQIHRSKHV